MVEEIFAPVSISVSAVLGWPRLGFLVVFTDSRTFRPGWEAFAIDFDIGYASPGYLGSLCVFAADKLSISEMITRVLDRDTHRRPDLSSRSPSFIDPASFSLAYNCSAALLRASLLFRARPVAFSDPLTIMC